MTDERATGATDVTEQPTYETATTRIEEIIRRLDSGEAGLRETLDLCSEGRSLIEFCAGELETVGQGLQELRLEELVARLETSQARGTSGTLGEGELSGSGGPAA
ncbi:MAG TPA: exodeoxyribonuclease VII small subunit [Solirubrobacteraceae bacterium]|nr:exodeoxyribonuclease VII small subunit [Solirubrobacteraceae bacterium]